MKTMEIWPKEVELGDAVSPGLSVLYLKLTDPEEGKEVVAFLRPEAVETMLAQLAHFTRKGKAH